MWETIRAAKYLGVAPWDLAEQPACWQEWGLLFEMAEEQYPAIAEKIAEGRRNVGG